MILVRVAWKVEQPTTTVRAPLRCLGAPRAVFVGHAVLQSSVIESEAIGIFVCASLVAENFIQDPGNHWVVQQDL